MGYAKWLREHGEKHKEILKRLLTRGVTQTEIINYFDFENMKEKEPDFCPLYKQNRKCHDIKHLNCYLCSCPNFRFSDTGIKEIEHKLQYSYCNINSKDGRQGIYGHKIHQDCSRCQVPHTREYVAKHFDLDWTKIMSDCEIST